MNQQNIVNAVFEHDQRTSPFGLQANQSVCVLFAQAASFECHHIVQEADGGDNSFDNCIPLCLNCHGRVASYNPRHPIGNQYSEKELKQRRNNFYAQMNPDRSGRFPPRQELEPPIDYKGFSIEEEHGLFAVRFYQKNPDLMHDFKPWCDSVEEAKAVVDKLVARAAGEDTGSQRKQ